MTPADPVSGHVDPESLFDRPEVYPLDFEPGHLNLVPMTRDTYRRSIFTDRGRIVTAASHGWRIPIGTMLDQYESRERPWRTVFFIYHIAHCGSTLLARAMDLDDRTLVIREPFALRQLAADAAAAGRPADSVYWRRCLRLTMALLGRRFDPHQTVIVKANVPVNFILDPLLALDPDCAGVALYSGFEAYLLSVLKTPAHRRWVVNVSRQLAGGIHATAGLDDVDVGALEPARAAACLWLAQISRLRAAVAAHEDLRGLDCRVLFDRPAEVLESAMRLAGSSLTRSEATAIADGELFRRHAKDPGREFDREARERELAALAAQYEGEVEAARDWIVGIGAWDGRDLPIIPSLL